MLYLCTFNKSSLYIMYDTGWDVSGIPIQHMQDFIGGGRVEISDQGILPKRGKNSRRL